MSDEEKWEFSITWHIEDYSFCRQETNKEIRSPIFTVEPLNNTQWYLSIYPGGKNEDSKEYISAYLNKSKDNKIDESITIAFEFFFKNEHEKLSKINNYFGTFMNGGGLGLHKFIKRDDLLRKMKVSFSNILSMHCRMKKKDDETKSPMIKKDIRTRILSDKCTFEWKINFENLSLTLRKRTFFCLGAQFYQISLNLLQEDIIIMVQQLAGKSSCSNELIGEIALMDAGGNAAFSESSEFSFETDKDTWTFPSFLTKSKILDKIRENAMHEQVVFLCKFFLSKESKSSIPMNSTGDTIFDFKNILELRHDFQNMFKEKVNADIKLRLSDGVEVQAHRAVLVARSPVLSAMFNQDMLENRTGIIDIADVDHNTLTSFLEFLYTGAVDHMDWEKASKLVVMADKYQVSTLKEMLVQHLVSTLTVDNVCEILVLAEMVLHDQLKKACVAYAADHRMAIFSCPDRSDWIKENSKLCAEIIVASGNTPSKELFNK